MDIYENTEAAIMLNDERLKVFSSKMRSKTSILAFVSFIQCYTRSFSIGNFSQKKIGKKHPVWKLVSKVISIHR